MDKQATRILVVDDEKILRNLLERTLQVSGYEVDCAEDGMEAVEQLQATPYRIVITDLMMPRMDGMELLRYIKKNHPDTAVIIITGFASIDSAMMAVREGAYDYITKPFQIEAILHSVEKARERVELVQEKQQLIDKLERAYDKIEALLGEKENLSKRMEGVEVELVRRREEVRNGMFALRRYQSELDQYKNLAPKSLRDDGALEKIREAAKLRDEGKISQKDYFRLKERLLEES